MRKSRQRRSSQLSALLVAAISEFNKHYNLAKASKALAREIAAQRVFAYARHDPRSRKLNHAARGVITPEIAAYAGALVLCGWVAWVHHAKGIWHFNESSVSGEVFLSHEFLPNLMRAVAIGRSKAVLEKIKEGRYHPEFRVDDAIRILENSLRLED